MLNIAENTYLSDLILDLEGVCVYVCVGGVTVTPACVCARACAQCVVYVWKKKRGKNRKKEGVRVREGEIEPSFCPLRFHISNQG